MGAQQATGTILTSGVNGCQRCGKDHKALKFRKLSNPVDAFSWWATCPTVREPVFLAMVTEKPVDGGPTAESIMEMWRRRTSQDKQPELNIDAPPADDKEFELARAIHRTIRAMHDGHCPACGHLADCNLFICVNGDHACPSCGERITAEEAKEGLGMFLKYMRRNWARFLAWRDSRDRQQTETPIPPDEAVDALEAIAQFAFGQFGGEYGPWSIDEWDVDGSKEFTVFNLEQQRSYSTSSQADAQWLVSQLNKKP